MTALGPIGRLALALHLRKHPKHVGTDAQTAVGIKSYYCATCGYPLYKPEEWAEGTGRPVPKD